MAILYCLSIFEFNNITFCVLKQSYLFIVLSVFLTTTLFGQATFKVDPESKITINGTSTLHDWSSDVGTIKGTYIFKDAVLKKKLPTSGSITEEVKLVIPVTSIKSERGDAMNNKTHNAFKYETNPEIIFKVTSDKVSSTSDTLTIKIDGTLIMAGHTENITLNLNIEKVGSKLHFTGAHTLNMVTYEMEPPSAMFGQIKTGEEVTIEFDLLLNNE